MVYSCVCISDFQMEVVSNEKVCGNIDDCGPDACRNENFVDEVNDYTCDCDEDYELMLLVNGSVCVAKECEFFSRTRFNGADVNVKREVSEHQNKQHARPPFHALTAHRSHTCLHAYTHNFYIYFYIHVHVHHITIRHNM